MISKTKISVILVSIALCLASCEPEEFKTKGVVLEELNPEYAIPIVNSNLSLDKLISNTSTGFIRKQSDGFLSMVYRGTMQSSKAEEIINIADQNYIKKINLTLSQANALNNGQQQVIEFQTIQGFNAGGREIDSIWLKAGTFATLLESMIKTSGTISVTIVDAIKNGKQLIAQIPFNYQGNTPVNGAQYLPLVGFHWDMSKGGQGYNEIKINYSITLNPTTETLNAGDEIQISTAFQGIKFSRFYGYIGKIDLFDSKDTIDLSIFDNSKTGNFSIDDAIIKIKTGNSIGADIVGGITKLEGYTKGSGNYTITNPPNPLPIRTPSINDAGKFVYDSAIMNKLNSNVPLVINKKPKQIIFQAYIKVNPSGKLQRNFVTDNSQLKIDIEIELPLYGTAQNMVMEEEQKTELEMPEDEEIVENLMIRFTGNNGFPIDLSTQVYFVDSFNVVFDSLFSNINYKFLEAAQIGSDGKVTLPTNKTTDIMFDKERAKRLSRLSKLKIRAELSTLNNGGVYPSVKLYSNYKLGIKIGIKTKLNLKLKNL